jgi:hypothetical protein
MGLGLNLIIYYMNYPIHKVGLIEKLFEKISVVIQGMVGKCNSFVMEMYKIIILQKGWLIFIIFILAMNYNSIHKGLNYGSQNIYLKKYYDMFAGEKIGKDEYDFLEELKIEKNVVINSSDETAYNMLKANQIKDAIEHIEQQLNYLEELKKNNIEGCIIDESPYVEVFGERLDGFNETQGLICILTMILLFSNTFNIEKKTKMQMIIRSSFGRRKVWNEKTGCTLAISTIVTLITIGFKWRNICKYYDLSNMDVPIQSISMMKGCPLSVSICGYIIITNIIFIMATIAISLVIMCLSYYVGYVQSIAICFISMVPYLLYVFKLKVMEYLSIPVLLDINRTLVKTGFGIYMSLVYITLFVVTMAIMIRTYKRWNE